MPARPTNNLPSRPTLDANQISPFNKRAPSYSVFSTNADYQLNYFRKENEKLSNECDVHKESIKNYETAISTLTTAFKAKQKDQKAKNKIVSSYLEQAKLDHQAEVQTFNEEIKSLKAQVRELKSDQAEKTMNIAQLVQSNTNTSDDPAPNIAIKEKVIEKVVERVVEDTSKIKRLKQ